MDLEWERLFAQRTLTMRSSAIRELLKVTENRDVISFAGGLPAPELFPIAAFHEACSRLLAEKGESALQYGTTEGYRPLREFIAREHSSKYMALTTENVLITASSQQALDLLGKLFFDPGDSVLVEAPTYVGALQAFRMYGANFLSTPIDEDGMCCDALEEVLPSELKFIYVVPNFQNPTGVTLSLPRRMRLLQLARQHGVPIVEDNPYEELRFEGDRIPSLISLDGQSRRGLPGNVIHLGTFSKTLAPGLRLGWVVAPAEIIRRLALLKQGTDLHTSTFSQMLAYEIVRDGFLRQHIAGLRAIYRERCAAMLRALEELFPAGVIWTHPRGGLFLWITLPEGVDSAAVLDTALQAGVAFVPGKAFYPDPELGFRHMRLNFSNSPPEKIREGVRRLSEAVRQGIQFESYCHHR